MTQAGRVSGLACSRLLDEHEATTGLFNQPAQFLRGGDPFLHNHLQVR